MTIRFNLVKCLAAGGTPDEIARRICGMLSCECSLDNGNGWYDDDPEMADGGLAEAEKTWLRDISDYLPKQEAALREFESKWDREYKKKGRDQ